MDVIDCIAYKQSCIDAPEGMAAPRHVPEMLLIGCVDARLDIIDDIGIPKGKALIKRNIAALIAGTKNNARGYLSESATLELAVDVMKVRHIAVMGHTGCGGIRVCVEGADAPHIQQYLAPLKTVRGDIAASDMSVDEQARRMEQEAVRLSIENLRSYESVRSAETEGRLTLHGWVIDTATRQLSVLNETTGAFAPMRSGAL